MDAAAAMEKLMNGNRQYMDSGKQAGDVSARIRSYTAEHGQSPFAVIVACSDSRVIPEVIFQCGIGDLFVVRVAGNVIDDHQLGSIEYAADHLGAKLVMVLGHTHCGAVDAAIHHEPAGYIRYITDDILKAAGEEKDPYRAGCLNVRHSAAVIEESLTIRKDEADGLKVVGAMYDIESGKVSILD